jgi:PAS domain S-box-containing protein
MSQHWKREYERFRDFAFSAADWVWEMDESLRFTWMSQSVKATLGVAPEWHYGKTRRELLGSNFDSDLWEPHLKDLEAQRPFRDFTFFRSGDNDIASIWIRTSGTPVFDDAGVFQGYRGSARDVTAEMKAQERAGLVEDRLQDAIESLEDAFALYDADDRLVLWNDAFERMNSRVTDVLKVGTTFENLMRVAVARGQFPKVTDANKEDWIAQRVAHHRLGKGTKDEQKLSDGHWYMVRERLTRERGVVGVWSDVTRLKDVQAAENVANQRARLLSESIEQLNELFVLWGENDELVMCNNQFRLLNAAVADTTVPGTPFEVHVRAALAKGLYPAATGREEEWFRERVSQHKSPSGPFEQLRQDGRCLLIHEQQLAGAIVTISLDITEQKQAEQRTRQNEKFQAVGQLVGGIAHDFNNLLTTILGNSALGMRRTVGTDNPKLHAHFEEIELAGRRGRDVVRQLLTFSRGDTGKAISIYLGDVLDESRVLLRAAIPTSIQLTIDNGSDTPILFDPGQLQQVIMNLCLNARDAMNSKGNGHLTVESLDASWAGHCASCGEPFSGEFVQLRVSDAGEGLAPSLVERIFDPFFTTKSVRTGSGLGLSMVHGITHQHGGHVQVESTLGGGTTVRVFIPPTNEPAVPVVQRQEPPAVFTPRERRVAIIEDDVSVAKLLAEFFASDDYRVSLFTDPKAALQALLGAPMDVDIVVTDQTMPGHTGFEVAQAVLASRPDLPIILCTGYSDEIDEEAALATGIRAYVEKPVDLAELVQLASNILDEKGSLDVS